MEACQFKIKQGTVTGTIRYRCGKPFYKVDKHGRCLCQKHYNRFQNQERKRNESPPLTNH